MNVNHPGDTDEFIARIVEAFEHVEAPPRPSDAETIRLLSSGTDTASELVVTVRPRRLIKILAPLAALAASMAAILLLWPSTQNIVFAQIVEQVKKADSVTFSIAMTLKPPGSQGSIEVSGKCYAKSPNWLRYDLKAKGLTTINIMNSANGVLISCDPVAKTATIWEGAMSGAANVDVVGVLKEADADFAKRVVDSGANSNPNLETFELSQKEGPAVGMLWVDKQTKLPVRIELHGQPESGAGGMVYSDFDWNATIADSMFEIPADFTLTTNNLLAEPTEDELVAALRIRQAFSNEPYPADFLAKEAGLVIGRLAYDHSLSRKENYQRQLKVLRPVFTAIGVTDADSQDPKALQARIDLLCMKLDQWAEVITRLGGWVGGGVRPGQKKPLCWWRLPVIPSIRVLDADLTIHNAERPPIAK
jgi:outer membrane lipoprotein-sorting protein